MIAKNSRKKSKKLSNSRMALAIPVTFLILFFSMLVMIAVTYYYSIERVTARSQFLKVSMSKQSMTYLDETVLSVLGQPGSSRTIEFNDYGGELNVWPSDNALEINITDGASITDTIFNASIGQAAYELPYAEAADTGLFLEGDSRVIVNQTGLTMTQLYIRTGEQHPEIALSYRPVTSFSNLGTIENKTSGSLRVYVISLNSSENFRLAGQIPLKISCTSIQNIVTTYDISYQLNTLTLTAILNGTTGQVSIPVSSIPAGARINVELIFCQIKIERWVR